MDAKHTPGPWNSYESHDDVTPNIHYVHEGGALGGELIATVFEHADARLIAAAPELLEALETLIKASPRQYDAALTKAYEAIAKARGK